MSTRHKHSRPCWLWNKWDRINDTFTTVVVYAGSQVKVPPQNTSQLSPSLPDTSIPYKPNGLSALCFFSVVSPPCEVAPLTVSPAPLVVSLTVFVNPVVVSPTVFPTPPTKSPSAFDRLRRGERLYAPAPPTVSVTPPTVLPRVSVTPPRKPCQSHQLVLTLTLVRRWTYLLPCLPLWSR